LKDVIFIHPPPDINPKNLQKSLMPPYLIGYGLLHIATYLKSNGFDVEVWNIPMAYFNGFNLDDIKALITFHDPSVIGIELNWLQFSSGSTHLIKLIKEINNNIKIVFGGVHATIFAEYLIKNYPEIDAIFLGEAELSMFRYLEAIENNKPVSSVPGVYIRKNGKISLNEHKEVLPIDDIPPYDLSLIKPRLKESFNIGSINTVRGPCIFNCPYCIGSCRNYPQILGSREKLAIHSPEWVLKQIKILLRTTKNLAIQDYIYCSPNKYITDLFSLLKKEKISDKIEYFNIAAKPGSFDRDTLKLMSEAGIDNIDYGVETGSGEVLKNLRRGYSPQQVLDSIETTVKSGIFPKTYWMVGLPGEKNLTQTKELIQKTIELGGFPRWVTPLIILPGTELFDNPQGFNLEIMKKSYEDFLSFSTTKLNRDCWYPEVITHKTEFMNVENILNAANEIKNHIISFKSQIMDIFNENLEKYYHLHQNVKSPLIILRMKRILDTLKNTIF
jgi:radical SAM superfamily enzyme YgiQ (UPF0313 family)